MFVSLDLETTGFSPQKDKIIEFGAIKFDFDGKKETFQTFINPNITLPDLITHITNISNEDLQQAPTFEEKKQEIQDFIGDLPIIGHNIQFDINFLKENGIELNNPQYDTFELAGIMLPNLDSYSLEILTTELDLKHKEKHRALDDSIAAMELFLKLTKKFQQLTPELIKRIKSACEKSNWPLKKVLLNLAPTSTNSKKSKTTQKQESTQKLSPESQKQAKSIAKSTESGLFEFPKPYEDIIPTLIKNISPDAYISLPQKLFKHLSQTLQGDIAKIDSPGKYLSPKRLQEFEEKQFFENHEITALIKYLIWSQKTETGLLSEVTIFINEKSTLQQVNANPNTVNIEEEPFIIKAKEQDASSPAICSHDYTIQENPKIKELIIIDFEQFTRSLYYHKSTYINLELFTNPLTFIKSITTENSEAQDLIETLLSKCTILFGIIGIIFEKTNDQNPYTPRTTFNEGNTNTKEWLDIKNIIKNLIEISKDLLSIKTNQNIGYLKDWKENLREIQEIFETPDFEKNLNWIEQDFTENTVLRKAPNSLQPHFQKISQSCETFKIIEEEIDYKNNAKFIKNTTGLPQKIPLYKNDEKIDNLDIFILENSPEYDSTPYNHRLLPPQIIDFLDQSTGQIALIFNSKKQIEKVTLLLGKKLTNKRLKIISQLSGSIGKLEAQYKENPKNSILILSTNAWLNIQDLESIHTIIIDKLPFHPPSDPFIVTLSQKYEDSFTELQIPLAHIKLKKIIKKLIENKKSHEILQAIILDDRIITKGYGKKFIEALREIATPKITNTANFLGIVK